MDHRAANIRQNIDRNYTYTSIYIGGTLLAGGTTFGGTPLAVGTTPNTR